MSIATEITRLQNAKADIKNAIEAKGVTVPASEKLDTYAAYISNISGSGSLLGFVDAGDGGTVTVNIPSGITKIHVLAMFVNVDNGTLRTPNDIQGSIIVQNSQFTVKGSVSTSGGGYRYCVTGEILLSGSSGTISLSYSNVSGATDHMLYWVFANTEL